jgi:alpha-D-ribose 1-methylphosphonate 5-triphosphate diphosphatase
MGAPNARRGRSHLGTNLSARDALAHGALGVLASDYHPASLLASVYAMADHDVCGWAEAVDLVTANPARAVGLDDRGRLAPGQRADLVAVVRRAGVPSVAQTWVAGRPCFTGGCDG